MKDEKRQTYWLYVLKCEQDKKYVGITTKTPDFRMRQHQNNFLGAAWTKKYRPIGLLDKKNLGEMTHKQAEAYENKVVRLYIHKYGYNNVRGGDITSARDYLKRFGYYWDKQEWEFMTVLVLLILALVLQGILYFLKW